MKFYTLDSEFTFGKFSGKTLQQVIDLQPSYIDWCACNLGHFYVSEDEIEKIKEIIPGFSISSDGQQKMLERYTTWVSEQEDIEEYDDSPDPDQYGYDPYEDFTDWSHYNDNLDMDQQSIEFWNQF